MKIALAGTWGKTGLIEPNAALLNVSLLLFAAVFAFCACGKKPEKTAGITLLTYPAVEGKVGDKDCSDFRGRCLIFQADKPLFRLDGFGFRPLPSISEARHDRVVFFLDTKQAADFGNIPEKHIGEGKRLALVYRGRILLAPELRARIKANALTIDFCNTQTYETVLSVLRGEKPPDYEFSEEQARSTRGPMSKNKSCRERAHVGEDEIAPPVPGI